MMNDKQATMTWMDGRSYVGCFVDNRREGHGLCIQKNGKKYEGMWVDGKPEGKGIETWPDGKKYEG